MIRALFASFLILFAPLCSFSASINLPFDADTTPTAEIVPTLTPSGYIGYITPRSNAVNVRGGPGMTYPIVQALKVGESLPVLMLNEAGWYQVEIVEGGEGQALAWVSGNVVTFRQVD